jgi:REP element-mobilizing transposase RayT
MSEYPLAYHITFGTYGTRLHGDDRPHVDVEHNEYGTPFPEADPFRSDEARARMTHDPVEMTFAQRREVEAAIREVASRYGWTTHEIASKPDHTHVVITADRVGDALRDALKAVVTRRLNKMFGVRPWWAEGGSAKYIWDHEYFARASKYVRDQKDI